MHDAMVCSSVGSEIWPFFVVTTALVVLFVFAARPFQRWLRERRVRSRGLDLIPGAFFAEPNPSAVRMVREHRPDAVLCDIGLPGMDGYEVARKLRAQIGKGVRLVAVSGYAQPEDIAKATEAGFDGHVAKPLDPGTLTRLLGESAPGG